MIASLNSTNEPFNEIFLPIFDNYDELELLRKIDTFEANLVSLSNFNNFLTVKWPKSAESVRKKVQSHDFSSKDDIELCLAALLFNANISLPSEDVDKRTKLLEMFEKLV